MIDTHVYLYILLSTQVCIINCAIESVLCKIPLNQASFFVFKRCTQMRRRSLVTIKTKSSESVHCDNLKFHFTLAIWSCHSRLSLRIRQGFLPSSVRIHVMYDYHHPSKLFDFVWFFKCCLLKPYDHLHSLASTLMFTLSNIVISLT